MQQQQQQEQYKGNNHGACLGDIHQQQQERQQQWDMPGVHTHTYAKVGHVALGGNKGPTTPARTSQLLTVIQHTPPSCE